HLRLGQATLPALPGSCPGLSCPAQCNVLWGVDGGGVATAPFGAWASHPLAKKAGGTPALQAEWTPLPHPGSALARSSSVQIFAADAHRPACQIVTPSPHPPRETGGPRRIVGTREGRVRDRPDVATQLAAPPRVAERGRHGGASARRDHGCGHGVV